MHPCLAMPNAIRSAGRLQGSTYSAAVPHQAEQLQRVHYLAGARPGAQEELLEASAAPRLAHAHCRKHVLHGRQETQPLTHLEPFFFVFI